MRVRSATRLAVAASVWLSKIANSFPLYRNSKSPTRSPFRSPDATESIVRSLISTASSACLLTPCRIVTKITDTLSSGWKSALAANIRSKCRTFGSPVAESRRSVARCCSKLKACLTVCDTCPPTTSRSRLCSSLKASTSTEYKLRTPINSFPATSGVLMQLRRRGRRARAASPRSRTGSALTMVCRFAATHPDSLSPRGTLRPMRFEE